MRVFSKILFLGLFLLKTIFTQDKCYVLGMEGGGDHGAYQAGVFKAIVDILPKEKRAWDVVSGVSAGSMNAFSVSIFPKGEEEAARDFILNNWLAIKGYTDLYKNWRFGGIARGLLFETSLYDTSPLRELLTKLVNGSVLHRDYVLGATNMETGLFEDFNDLQPNEYIDAIMSSGAYPVFFPNMHFRNKTWMDGGVKVSVDLPTGVIKCRNKGFNDSDIVVDVLLNDVKTLKREDVSKFHPLDVLYRVYEIYSYDETMRDLEEMSRIYPNVTIRYVVAPTKRFPDGSIPLNFKPDQMKQMVQLGIDDGTNVVKMGEGVNYQLLRKQYLEERVSRMYGKKSVTDEDIDMYLKATGGASLKRFSEEEKKPLKFLN